MIFRILAMWWVIVATLAIAGVDVGAVTTVCTALLAALYTWNLGNK